MPTSITADESKITRQERLPIILSMVILSCLPIARESTEPEPIPKRTAIALLISTKGDAAETALIASVPTI